MSIGISSICHPEHTLFYDRWCEWRTIYTGGDCFVKRYVSKFSSRETTEDFNQRLAVTPCSAFAKAAVNDVKNSIYQRTADVIRSEGDTTYQRAMQGLDGGVDMSGSSMNYFVGRYVLPELMTMSKVGVFVDMPRIEPGETEADTRGKKPYLYMYTAEQIKSWSYAKEGDRNEFQALLLEECHYCNDNELGLPCDETTRYRYVWKDEAGKVWLQYYNSDNLPIDDDGIPQLEPTPIQLGVKRIPFVVFQLNDSLLADISRHQIALVNLESSDVIYALMSNIPIYTEQADPNDFSNLLSPVPNGDGTAAGSLAPKDKEITIGHMRGRTFAGSERPGFINPSSEPLTVSMAKQKQLKDDIRALINLALSNTKQHVASAESKELDERGLEAGLSNIGLELEQGERKIAELWAAYVGGKAATVQYPRQYSLRTDADRQAEADALTKLIPMIPSKTACHEIQKQAVSLVLGPKLPLDTIKKIYKEIDDAEFITAIPKEVNEQVAAGILSKEHAAMMLGLPKEQVQQAKDDEIEKATKIAEAQGIAKGVGNDAQARGIPAMGTNANAGKDEKKQAKAEGKPTRGDGK